MIDDLGILPVALFIFLVWFLFTKLEQKGRKDV